MKPLVSVNITTYNRAHLLPRCLSSVLSQSYSNIEVVLVDDASKDNTREVVSKHQSLDSRIYYYKHEVNQGLASSRNTALQHSNGEYIAFMDDDDEWIDVDKLKKQIELFERSVGEGFALICSSVRLYSNEGKYKEKIISAPDDLKSRILSGNGIIYSPTVMTPKSILEQVGGFDVRLPRGVDSDFYRCCIVKHGYGVYFMPDVTTAIHEYGDDRITLSNGRSKARKIVFANLYILRKYAVHFVLNPSALFRRIKVVVIGLLLYAGVVRRKCG